MKVLLACEESQIVTKAFIDKGHNAMSCDIVYPGALGLPHYEGDIMDIINDDWDLMLAFPPCTHLAVSGARWFPEKIKDGRQQQGIDFFMEMINATIPKIAVENPVGIMSTIYRKPDQIIQPYYFGDEAQKTTCLWLHNLKPLLHNEKTHVDKGEMIEYKSGRRMPKWYADQWGKGSKRSIFWPGIAKAMAEQWG